MGAACRGYRRGTALSPHLSHLPLPLLAAAADYLPYCSVEWWWQADLCGAPSYTPPARRGSSAGRTRRSAHTPHGPTQGRMGRDDGTVGGAKKGSLAASDDSHKLSLRLHAPPHHS